MATQRSKREENLTVPTVKNTDQLSESLKQLNAQLVEQGMLPLELIRPTDCIAAEVNARYMTPETMQTFIENVKSDKRLESVPLVWKDPELPEGKVRIISGHHRIEVAKAAGIEYILVMVANPSDRDDVVSKQLAHNSLVGMDDSEVLATLFNSIQDITKRFATGLTDTVGKISYGTINFKVGTFKEVVVLFVPSQLEDFESLLNEISIKAASIIKTAPMDDHKDFISALQRIKKVENIKSTGSALSRIVELAKMKLDEMESRQGKEDSGAA